MVGLNIVQAALRMLMVLKVIYYKIVDSELNKTFLIQLWQCLDYSMIKI